MHEGGTKVVSTFTGNKDQVSLRKAGCIFVLVFILVRTWIGFGLSIVSKDRLVEGMVFSANNTFALSMPSCSPYAQTVTEEEGVKDGEDALCAPDNRYAELGLASHSELVLDMGHNNEIVDGPGVDLYFYEYLNGERVYLDWVEISIAPEDEDGKPGTYTPVFIWGDGDPLNNGVLSADIPELPNEPIPEEQLHQQSGIGIDIENAPGEIDGTQFRFVRIRTVPDDATPEESDRPQIDAIENVHVAPPSPTITLTPTATLTATVTTITPHPTVTTSVTLTVTPTITTTPPLSPTSTFTPDPTPSETATLPLTPSVTISPTSIATGTPTPTPDPSPIRLTPKFTSTVEPKLTLTTEPITTPEVIDTVPPTGTATPVAITPTITVTPAPTITLAVTSSLTRAATPTPTETTAPTPPPLPVPPETITPMPPVPTATAVPPAPPTATSSPSATARVIGETPPPTVTRSPVPSPDSTAESTLLLTPGGTATASIPTQSPPTPASPSPTPGVRPTTIEGENPPDTQTSPTPEKSDSWLHNPNPWIAGIITSLSAPILFRLIALVQAIVKMIVPSMEASSRLEKEGQRGGEIADPWWHTWWYSPNPWVLTLAGGIIASVMASFPIWLITIWLDITGAKAAVEEVIRSLLLK